jgi:hypothetical protein
MTLRTAEAEGRAAWEAAVAAEETPMEGHRLTIRREMGRVRKAERELMKAALELAKAGMPMGARHYEMAAKGIKARRLSIESMLEGL